MQQRGPWAITNSVTVYQNPWMSVREDAVVQPDGKTSVYGTIDFSADGGVRILPIDAEGMVYLEKTFKYGTGKEEIDTVAGAIEGGEEPLAAAQRELREELGFEAQEWIHLGMAKPLIAYTDHPVHYFLARQISEVSKEEDVNEMVESYRVSMSEAVAMALDGRIVNEGAALLVLKAQAYIDKNR